MLHAAARIIGLLALLMVTSELQAEQITVAAASSLRPTLDQMVEAFEEQHPGDNVVLVYGASGRLTTQILNGAPFDLFLSANTEFPEQIAAEQTEASVPQLYAAGQLVLWSANQDVREVGWQGLLSPDIRRIAIAQPDIAPYGQRAKEALMHYGVWNQIQGKLVYGESVSQTARMALSGAADVALIAASLVRQDIMQQQPYMPVDVSSHLPLNQSMVVTAKGSSNSVAIEFSRFVMSDQGQSILTAAGFLSVPITGSAE